MSFYKIPQNYAPGFVPQRYTFINDAAAATLKLSDFCKIDSRIGIERQYLPDKLKRI